MAKTTEQRKAELARIETIHAYALSEPGAIDDRPFRPDLPVYKIGGKMFAYLSPSESPPFITLKLEPMHGQLLRSTYAAVMPGYHMNKDHWNSIDLDGSIDDAELLTWADESYELVVSKLTRAQKEALQDSVRAKDAE